ncbi:MAG: RagB/SusD family nutrient uptake outer membrane protein [Flavobacteriaceae bacterium]|nr:RagB/SusD family nutrient uptake outer membrane protein [Flavobacteriaceae bacterium]
MKNIKLVTIILVGLLLVNCSDDFLDQQKLGEETSDVFFNSQEKAVASVTAAYSDLKDYRFGWMYWAFGETLSDNAIYGGSDGDLASFSTLKSFNVSPSLSKVRMKWQICYRGINKSNQAIDGISKMDNALFESPKMKNRLIAEAKVLRAFYHFELARSFGDIPIVDHLIKTADERIKKSSQAEVFDFIIKSLKEAEPNLPKKSEYENADLGRVTQGFAEGLLAKVNLYAKNFQEAKKWAKKVIDSKEYQLDSDYAHIFSFDGEHGVESLFEISFYDSPTEKSTFRNNGNFQTLFMLPRNITYGYGINLPTEDLAKAYDDAGDSVRKKATLLTTEEVYKNEDKGNVLNSGDEEKIKKYKQKLTFDRTGYYQKKMYVLPADRSLNIRNNANNIRVMRYADVLLMYAEACAELGEEGEAQNALNKVRNRVGLPAFSGSGQVLKDAIFNERRLELAGESERYHDLVRTGRANATILPDWTEGHKYWPVPQLEVDITSGDVEQNTGY